MSIAITCHALGTDSKSLYAAFMLSRPSPEIKKLQIERTEANIELAGIKSIQLELVRHSLLTRKIIKYDKQIEKLQGEYMPKLKKVRNASRIVRVLYLTLLLLT